MKYQFINGTETVCYTGNGQNYRGQISRTYAGIPCQKWFLNAPHKHSFRPETYRSDDLVNNYCRNPSGFRKLPWCYTQNASIPWQYCDVSKCRRPTDFLTSVDPYKSIS